MSNDGFLSWIVVKLPWLPLLGLLPICIVYDCFCFFRLRWNYLFRHSNRRRDKHLDKVAKVQEQVVRWNQLPDEKKVPMCTARPGYKSITLQTLTYKDRLYKIAIDLPDILHVDEENRTVTVEPMVTIGQLNDYLVERGWTLPVVPEIDDLTIGGLVRILKSICNTVFLIFKELTYLSIKPKFIQYGTVSRYLQHFIVN